MRARVWSVLLVFFLGWGAAAGAWAQAEGSASFDAAGTSAREVSDFLDALKKAVAADDRDGVAALFSFPARVPLNGKPGKVANRKALLAAYDGVFDVDLKKTIAEARVEQVFANAQGVMIGDGRLWFAPVGTKPKLAVITINPVPAAKK